MRLLHKTTDSLDRPNPPPAVLLPDYASPSRPARPGPPIRWVLAGMAVPTLVGLVIVALPAWALARAVADALTADAGAIRWLVRAVAVFATVGACLAILGGVRWLWQRTDRVLTLPGDMPVHADDLRGMARELTPAALAAHYDVQGRWADASTWRGTATYAPHITRTTHNEQPAAAPALPEPEPSTIAPLDDASPKLAQLAAKGYARPGALVAGFGAGGQPLHIDLALTGFVAVAGQPRSGKTTTALGLVAQAAHQGAALFVCDPHARAASGLLSRALPLSGCFTRQAVADEEIAAVVALVAKIARRRLAGQDAPEPPVWLVIDEFTALLARRALPEDVQAALLAVAVEAPKVHVHGLLLAQDWSSRLLGGQIGASLRRVVTHRIVHRTDPGSADFLLPVAALARQAATLTHGEALYWPADGMPAPITVPDMGTDADLHYAAQGRAPKPYAPRPALPPPPLAPTVNLATAPTVALTVAGRVKSLLADGQPRDSAAIAAALGEDKGAVQTALTRLAQAGEITRQGSPRRYEYTV